MPIEKLRPTFTFNEERLKELQRIAPEAFADGKVNWDTLKEALGEYNEEEGADTEHFGLNWPGKRLARKMAAMPSKGTLVPVSGVGVDEDTTGNIFIEGENLEVLKLLQKSYAERIKMIYIDPPYNTGSDFVYADDFTEPLEEYLRRTGQLDEDGKLQNTNKRASGRYHSNWLSMMYPRLRLARNLLRDDGIIFVSIDDNEMHHLRTLMNEIFGDENFLGQIVWKNKYGAGAKTRGFIEVHEYILCYTKNPISDIESELSDEQILEYDKNKDENYAIRGGFVTQPLMTNSLGDRINLQYPIDYNGEIIKPRKQWVWEKNRLLSAISKNEVIIKKKPDGEYSVRSKVYLKDENGNIRKGKPLSLLNGPFNQEGSKEVAELIGDNIFSFPKPSELIKFLFSFTINNTEEKDGIYLDFFSGSGTSAQAVLNCNQTDDGSRKFILVQLPEKCDEKSGAYKAKYRTISEITIDRLSKLSKQIKKENPKHKSDIGFKVFKLFNSNYSNWNDYSGKSAKELETLFSNSVSPLIEDWEPQNLLSEIMLIEGYPLDSKVETIKGKNAIQTISSDFYEHKLVVCLDKKLDKTTVANLKLDGEDIFICLDSAISNEDKVRLADKGRIKTI